MAVDLAADAIGTAHSRARCCWCQSSLVVGQVEQLRCWLCPQCWERQVRFGLFVTYGAAKARELGLAKAGKYCWHVPLPSQVAIYETPSGNLLWGGRAGPGKSTGARRWLYWRSMQVPGHEALLLRENWDQLEANHTVKMAVEVPLLGGTWYEGKRLAVFGKGSDQSLIYCGHMAETDAVTRYQGIEYGAIVADEASLYPVDSEGVPVLAELSTRARKTSTDRDGHRVEALFVPVTNPGGPSAQWLRDMFINHTPDFEKFPNLRPGYDADGRQVSGYRPEQWMYIAASLQDNPYMREDYKSTVLANLSGIRYKQLADGDWDAFLGQFFRQWEAAWHVRRAVLVH
jgi:hypothetical protein